MSARRGEIYLDNNATTRPYPEVIEAMVSALKDTANASSAHSAGERARRRVESARGLVAGLVSCLPEQIVFTSGATEANNSILLGFGASPKAGRLVTTAVEHPSILQAAKRLEDLGTNVIYLRVDGDGRIDLDRLRTELRTATTLVSIQWANNETGAIQPVEQIANICVEAGVPFHCDASQAVGKLPVSLETTAVDFLTFTAHKFGGPQGVGAIYARKRRDLRPLLAGGEQESGKRPGTENVAGIVGFGVAASLRRERLAALTVDLADKRDEFEHLIRTAAPGARVNASRPPRICNTSNVSFEGIDGEALVARLDADGIRASQASACHNSRPEPSHVLLAMGLSEAVAQSSVRFSLSEETSGDELAYVASCVARHCETLAMVNQRA